MLLNFPLRYFDTTVPTMKPKAVIILKKKRIKPKCKTKVTGIISEQVI